MTQKNPPNESGLTPEEVLQTLEAMANHYKIQRDEIEQQLISTRAIVRRQVQQIAALTAELEAVKAKPIPTAKPSKEVN